MAEPSAHGAADELQHTYCLIKAEMMGFDRAVTIHTFDINSPNDMHFPRVNSCAKRRRSGYLHGGPHEVGVCSLVCCLSGVVEEWATNKDGPGFRPVNISCRGGMGVTPTHEIVPVGKRTSKKRDQIRQRTGKGIRYLDVHVDEPES